jgi:hypothetical protein
MNTKFNPWPLGIVLAFVIFIAGMATAVGIAVTHRDNMVSEHYYEQELKFQDQINAATRAKISGAAIVHDASARQVFIRLPVPLRAEEPAGTIEFYRPAAPELDRQFPLDLQTGGTQSLDVSKFATGAWVVRLRWTTGGQDYYLEQKITVAAK